MFRINVIAPLTALLAIATGCADRAADDSGLGKTRGLLPPPADTLGAPPADGALVLLDSNSDLSHWRHESAPKEPLRWSVRDGTLTVVPKSGSIVTKTPVNDFRLHLEFKINDATASAGEPDGNSGIYIQRRYELQILDRAAQAKPESRCGAIYLVKAPDTVDATKPAGEWQCYDLVFRAARWRDGDKIENARLTAHLNGKLIHDDVPIPGTTGAGRVESPEPGPLKLQDHGNAVAFRNIWMVPLDL